MTAAAAVAAQEATSGEVVRMVRLEELDPSPFNKRVIVEDEAMRGLVESIRNYGIQQPLLCREVPVEGDIVSYQIVAGHRRHFAGGVAGIEFAPAIFREMTDDEAREIQIIENLQRAELPPLQEARAFNEAITFHGGKMLSVQELAARLGKSPVYINRRLTLLDAVWPVQEALIKGLIEVGHALELARLSESEQERLLTWLGVAKPNAGLFAAMGDDEGEDFDDEDEDFDDEEEPEAPASELQPTDRSVVELRKYIANTTLQILGAAPFDPDDSGLVEEAGRCADCLKRTGASPLLFSDVAGDDVCTDRSCFDGKVKALIARKIGEAKRAKAQLHQLTEDWQKKGPQIHYVHNVTEANNKRCGFLVEAIHIDGRDAGKTIEICLGTECKVHGRGSGRISAPAPTEKAKGERKALLAKVKIEKTYRARLLKECIAKPIDPLPTDEMVRALVLFAFTRIDSTKHKQLAEALAWDEDIFGWHHGERKRAAKLLGLSQADAIRIALVALEANELTVQESDVSGQSGGAKKQEIGLEQVARLIGVDASKVRAAVDPEFAKPKPAAKKAAVKKAPVKRAVAKPSVKKAPAKKAAAKKAAKKKAVKG